MRKIVKILTFMVFLACITPQNANAQVNEWMSLEYFVYFDLPEYTPVEKEKLKELVLLSDDEEVTVEQIDAETLYILGRMYQDGELLEVDEIRAEKLFKLAAESGHTKSQIALAVYYNFKNEVTKSKKWYKEAAEEGNALAKFQLGIFYEIGRGFFKNIASAVELYKEASELGYMKASLRLGNYYQYLEKPNYRDAIKYYKTAANQADKDEQLRISIHLARLYRQIAEEQGKEEKVFQWTKKAAELGDVNSQLKTAESYLNGIGTDLNYKEAIRWYKKASDNGENTAMTMIGYIYANGLGVEIDYKQAVTWYKYAAERGNHEAAWSLGNMYSTGNGVERDDAEAQKWFDRSEVLRKKALRASKKR